MSSLPTIQIPDIPQSAGRPISNGPVTPKTPKSMLRNLFNWKKAVPALDGGLLPPANPGHEHRPVSSGSKHAELNTASLKPSLSHRSRSDTAVPQRSKTRSKSRRRSRSRARAVWDPPPLFQAYTQAFMHDTLSVPNKGLLDWLPRNPTSRAGTKNSDTTDEDREEVDVRSRGHSRSVSSSSTTSNQKIFFLTEDGHILQYKLDGSHDRLPERVIELSHESVAFASDAIAGKHWVLEICSHGRLEAEIKPSAPKSSWSRMSLKAPEGKRAAEKMLIVFESPDTLFSWLIAIRKQIEGLGGMEYQPDTTSQPQPQPEPERPTLRHAASEHFKRKSNALPLSRASSLLPLRPDDLPTQNKDLPQLPTPTSYQRSTSTRSIAASSILTTTSLDRLRESYSGSSTTGTALSSDASLSPTKESFPAMLSPVSIRESQKRRTTDKPISQITSSPQELLEEQSSSETVSPQDDKHDIIEPSAAPEEFESGMDQSSEDRSSAEVDNMRRPATSGDRPMSIVAPLPVPELRRRLRQAQRNLSAGKVDLPTDVRNQQQYAPERRHVNKASLSTGTYGLFPKRLALDVKAEPLVVPDKNDVPGLLRMHATDHLEISESPITPIAVNFGSHLFARSNTTSKRPAPIALPQLLAPIELEQPMRSPAVTDAMLATNFGTSLGGSATSPATPIEVKVPGFEAIGIDQSLIESFREMHGQKVSSSPPRSRSIAPRRSMPNFHYSSTNVVSAPNGPPPSGPLPAVPPIPVSDDGRVSRSSTTSKRTSAQGSANRRPSTKSATSVRHARNTLSPASPPPVQISRAHSASRKKTTPPGSRAQTPSSTSSSPQRSHEAATTIGQVSVVAAPPRFSSLPQHKKSPSASSVKSNKSGKFHLRTPSGRSFHGSLANFSSITHVLTPTCGFESDSELTNRGCFGISSSR